MRFWFRELMGWLLVLVGGYILVVCLVVLLDRNSEFLLEAPVISVIGIVIFRGGIHLLKVAVAARICLHAQTQAAKPAPPASAKRNEAPWEW